MSKVIDFTQLGGMPLTQDRLKFLQEAWNEQCVALALVGGQGGAWIVWGCSFTRVLVTGTTYTYAMSEGWVYYNGQLLHMPGNSVDIDESVDAAYVELADTETALTYYDGSMPDVIQDTTVGVVAMPIGTASSGTLFELVNLMPWGHVPFTDLPGGDFGAGCANEGGSFYDVGYKVLDNEVELCGVLAGTTLGGTATIMTLPVATRPASKVKVWVYTEGYTGYNMIVINTDGTVVFDSAGGDSGIIYLDGVRYRVY